MNAGFGIHAVVVPLPPPKKKDLHNEEIENFTPNLNSHQKHKL